MTNYTEKNLESFIEAHLLESGYIKRESKDYDKSLGVDRELFLNFLHSTQAKTLQELEIRGIKEQELLKRIFSQIQDKGIVKALQAGVKIRDITIKLAHPKPNSSANPQSLENYKKNIFSITRQLYYSEKNNNSLDMVIFLNGLPLITMELKNPFTGQNVYNAIEQYKKDRDPRESIFKQSVVHFALDSDLIYMSTKLEGIQTKFLPFNRGLNNGSGAIGLECGGGNPAVKDKMKTSYFWEELLQKDTLSKLLFDFTIKNSKGVIFPRFHQFDVVSRLLKDVKEKGVGQRYLIQHSAGSGKSNSIAWLAHHLVSLHKIENDKEKEVFDSILVVTDRRVLDRQIQENVKSFTQDKNLVESITEGSRQLKAALEEGKKIIVTTIQKFPYIADEITHLQNKSFAIIIDEAHSSQSGKNAEEMGKAISNKDDKETGEMDLEEELIKIIKNKKFQKNASYFAFTATPKPKTLEMFGSACEINGEKKFIPFHLYSMKQAIEEGFILDVLKGYITYTSYYKIVSKNDNREYDKKKANAKLRAYVTNHIATIEKKATIMIEHFFQNICKKIGEKAKAMVVTSSRENAVKYYLFFKKYLQKNHPEYQALVAFSGVKEINGESYSEVGLNGFSEAMLKDEFKKDDYRFLIVAEKYQTGFDELLLHTMYVDKRLEGISAVQTLSRLNRICQNKEDTCVLDFVNTHEEIGKSFSTFYGQTYLKEPTNIDNIYTLKSELFDYGIYTQDELNSFIEAIRKEQDENKIHSKLDNMIKEYNAKSDDEKTEFYTKAKVYLREYSFLAQILPFNDIELEKLSILLKMLIAKIVPPRTEDLAKGILNNVDLNSIRIILESKKDISLSNNGELSPAGADDSSKKEVELERLSNIVREFNTKFGSVDFGTNEKIAKELMDLKDDIAKEQTFRDSLGDEQNARRLFADIFKIQYLQFFKRNKDFFTQLDNKEEFKERVSNAIYEMIDEGYQYNAFKSF
ncbi:type I restriction endonuclease subunit R [Campylobacter upsaliensis]|uniref:type I restriction endonuclease subunit R n=1 Tax=Campylobacter upsaliensis TaxID=28080 RepID=UPI00127564EF|nr:type I restriction endonuclease [Campylobacter upsaliensis]EAI1980109.1 type I restriction endonuclease subunit R [Campylobacter upsaliensis]EAK0960404.1 type I restriction endonuclease subunit R [Campylobacter upsaliensis]EAK4283339.1 type I restriction endonuclease subunit R [Campylobacter upsaliensis]EAK4313678.1 type I restriction endonuclease subunit R [Campylobacter upsaliensis]EAL3985416.1 type I restriction endonuclease subunit R [Campylobacter upsaliensis]